MYPMLLKPTLHVKVWGGRKLSQLLGKSLPTDEPYGESWELHDTSTVVNGEFAGWTLGDLLREHGSALIGPDNDPAEGFPLLAKLLDASDWLSVQVHPNDEQARALEGQPRGKTEAWVILDARPDAKLVIGVTPGTSHEAMAAAIRDNHLEDLLEIATVQAGDVLYMPAGTVHAIGPGIVIYEIQQSSNTTYRLYDWGRMGLDGKPRELHIEKGVQVSNVETLPKLVNISDGERVIDGAYFITDLHRLDETGITLNTKGRYFHVLTCIASTIEVAAGDVTVMMGTGQTVLVPAAVGVYTLHGPGQVLRAQQREG